jgi:hypothetical protein
VAPSPSVPLGDQVFSPKRPGLPAGGLSTSLAESLGHVVISGAVWGRCGLAFGVRSRRDHHVLVKRQRHPDRFAEQYPSDARSCFRLPILRITRL